MLLFVVSAAMVSFDVPIEDILCVSESGTLVKKESSIEMSMSFADKAVYSPIRVFLRIFTSPSERLIDADRFFRRECWP